MTMPGEPKRRTAVVTMSLLAIAAVLFMIASVPNHTHQTPASKWYEALKPTAVEAKLLDKALRLDDSTIVGARRIASPALSELFPRVVFVDGFRTSDGPTYGGRRWIAIDPKSGLTAAGARFGIAELFQMRQVRLASTKDADRLARGLDDLLNPLGPGVTWSQGQHEQINNRHWRLNANAPRPHIEVDVNTDGFVESVTYNVKVIDTLTAN